MNQITVNFLACSPMPSQGYGIYWRVAGSGDPLTNAGNFFVSPAVFTDETNPEGTVYEGVIISQCRNGVTGNPVNWSTIEESGSESESTVCNGNPITGAMDNDVVSICDLMLENLFLDPAHVIIQPGCTLYYDACMTQPVIGYLYVKDASGEIFNIDIDEGIVHSPTGDLC